VANAVDLDHTRPREPGAAAKQLDAMLGEPRFVTGIGERTAPRWPRQRLGRDAPPAGALATDQLVLDECDAQTALSSAPAQCSPGEPPPMTMTS
jgi:hypothetical protein